MNRQKNPQKSKPQPNDSSQDIPPAVKVFSKTRDLDSANPYHLDGDMQMYSQQKLQQRANLRNDPDIQKQLQQIIKMYELTSDGKITESEYKKMQRRMALALRPDIEQEELEFVVDEDWKLDSKDGAITVGDMREKVFELVDVWTIGVDKMEYVSFIKLLAKKIMKKK